MASSRWLLFKNDPIREQVRAVNAGISKLANGKIKFMDIGDKFLTTDGTLPRELFPDLLHPNEKGYQIWADALVPALNETMKQRVRDFDDKTLSRG